MKKNHFHLFAGKMTASFFQPFSFRKTKTLSDSKISLPENCIRYSPSPAEKNHKSRLSSIPSGNSSRDFQELLCSTVPAPSGKISASRIRSATTEADSGFLYDQAFLYRAILENEPVIAAHLQTRILAVCACDWQIAGRDPEKISMLSSILEKANINFLLRHLMESLAFGCAGAVIEWEEGGSSIKGFKSICQENFLFDAAGNPALRTYSGQIRPLYQYHPHQFILHYHKLKSGPCGSGGLLRPLLWLYFFKHYALRDRARFLEKFGVPFLIAKINQQDFENEDTRKNILAALNRISSDGSGVVTGESQIQTLSPGISASGEYQTFLDYIDKLYTLLILGQTASSSVSGGFSKGQIQENVRHDILEADCRALMETINNQLLRPLEKYCYGTDGEYRFILDFSSPENLLEKAQIIKLLSESNFAISPEWIEKAFNIRLEKQATDKNNP